MSSCIDQVGPGYQKICHPQTCDHMRETAPFLAICHCLDWRGAPIPSCDPKGEHYPVQTFECVNSITKQVRNIPARKCAKLGPPWTVTTCYCCCHGGYTATAVTIPGGTVQLGDLAVGDQVMTAHGSVAALDWQPTKVAFAVTTPPASTNQGDPPLMVHVGFGDGQSLIAHPEQLLLQPSGGLKRADQLVPGTDRLVGPQGQPLPVHRVDAGHYLHGLVHFATDASGPGDWNGSLDGHLLNLNGAVAGDYVLQLLGASGALDAHLVAKDAPDAAAPAPKPSPVAMTMAAAPPPQGFEPLAGPQVMIPKSAAALFTAAQEAAFAAAGASRASTDQTNLDRAQRYAKLFAGFFPDVTVQIDWGNDRPNIFAFKQLLKHPTVLVPGGFLRLDAVFGEAVAAAMAFGIANRSIPADNGSVAHSIYDGFGVILPQALDGSVLASTLSAAQAQFKALVARVTPEAAPAAAATPPPVPAPGPKPAPVAKALSLDCVLEIIDAAISGTDMPACAG